MVNIPLGRNGDKLSLDQCNAVQDIMIDAMCFMGKKATSEFNDSLFDFYAEKLKNSVEVSDDFADRLRAIFNVGQGRMIQDIKRRAQFDQKPDGILPMPFLYEAVDNCGKYLKNQNDEFEIEQRPSCPAELDPMPIVITVVVGLIFIGFMVFFVGKICLKRRKNAIQVRKEVLAYKEKEKQKEMEMKNLDTSTASTAV